MGVEVTLSGAEYELLKNILANGGAVLSLQEAVQIYGTWNGKAASSYHVNGRRIGFTSTSVYNDVKEYDNGVALQPELSNNSLDIVSSSANDTAGGTGIRSVKVVYINSSNNMVESAPIALNGTTPVTNVLTGVNAVQWMETATVGSGGVADGNIRLRINGGTVEVEQITANFNHSVSSRFMVPAGYSAYLTQWTSLAIGNPMDCRLRATVDPFNRSLNANYLLVDNLYVGAGAGLLDDLLFLKCPALSKIKASVIAGGTANTNRVDVSFDIVLIQN